MLQHQRVILVAGTLVSTPLWVTAPIRESPTAQLGPVKQEKLIQTAEASIPTRINLLPKALKDTTADMGILYEQSSSQEQITMLNR